MKNESIYRGFWLKQMDESCKKQRRLPKVSAIRPYLVRSRFHFSIFPSNFYLSLTRPYLVRSRFPLFQFSFCILPLRICLVEKRLFRSFHRTVIHLLLVSAIWAFSFGLIRISFGSIDPLLLAFLRLTMAALVFLPFLRNETLRWSIRTRLIGIGAIQYGAMYALLFSAFQHIGPRSYLIVL